MDRQKFEAADALVDEIADIVDEMLASEKTELLKAKLAELSKAVGSELSVSLDCRRYPARAIIAAAIHWAVIIRWPTAVSHLG